MRIFRITILTTRLRHANFLRWINMYSFHNVFVEFYHMQNKLFSKMRFVPAGGKIAVQYVNDGRQSKDDRQRARNREHGFQRCRRQSRAYRVSRRQNIYNLTGCNNQKSMHGNQYETCVTNTARPVVVSFNPFVLSMEYVKHYKNCWQSTFGSGSVNIHAHGWLSFLQREFQKSAFSRIWSPLKEMGKSFSNDFG